jgi:hypothetical protein
MLGEKNCINVAGPPVIYQVQSAEKGAGTVGTQDLFSSSLQVQFNVHSLA